MIDILEKLTWPVTIPLAIVIIALILRKSLGELIGRVRSISGEGRRYDVLFEEPSPESVPEARERIIEPCDVIEAFKEIRDFTIEETKSQLQTVYTHLLRNGITTKKTLNGLVKSKESLDNLRKLYIWLLDRPKENPLDPVAVATWGATLFRYGVRPEILEAVRNRIMVSDEFKHRLKSVAGPPPIG